MSRQKLALRHKEYYRRLDEIIRQIDEEQGLESMLTAILIHIGDQVFSQDVGISSGRLYRRDRDEYVVVKSFGARGKEILGQRIPADYAVLAAIDNVEVHLFHPGDERIDPQLEGRLGVDSFAAFAVGPDAEYIAAFGVDEDSDLEEVMLTLNTLRYAIQHRLRQVSLEGQLREAREIQVSLLPAIPPDFEGYELAGRSIPAEEVGGDIFDFLPFDENLMGLAIGDASGHGLPAALQARDVVTGLRMGVEKDLKITAVVERLNRVIHRSGLTSRFISLFYGELERNGNLVYVNAGHDPALLLRADGSTDELRSTGIVMGPLAEAHYRRAFATVQPGDVLLLYSDGVVERADPTSDEQFGPDRLESTVREGLHQCASLSEVADRVLETVHAFGAGEAYQDDATVVLVRRG